MTKGTKVVLIILLVLVVAIGAGVFFIAKKGDGINFNFGKGRRPERPDQAEVTAYTVETGKSVIEDITDYIKINGNVEPARSIDIYPDTIGKLNKLNVVLGEYVKVNQVIAQIDPSKPGLSYALSPVRSTIAGTVILLPYEEGATINAGMPVATIGDLSLLQVKTEVPEPYIGKISLNTKAETEFVAWPGKIFNAHVVEINPIVNSVTRTLGIKLEFDNDYPELKAGMFASIRLLTETHKNVVIVPSDTIITRDNKRYVFEARDNLAVMREIKTGFDVDGKTEVISGLNSGVEIVVRGQNLLDDGVEINVVSSNVLTNGNSQSESANGGSR